VNKFGTIYVSIIAAALVASLYVSSLGTSDAFVFAWTREEQKIVPGTLRIEISFKWKNESLNIIAKINDNKPMDIAGWLGLVFDRNGNGVIDYGSYADKPYLFHCSNWTYGHTPWLREDGYLVGCHCVTESPYHTAVLIEGFGWLYNVSIPANELAEVKADVVLIFYESFAYTFPYPMRPDWVATELEGWQ